MAKKKRKVIVWFQEEGYDSPRLAYRDKTWGVDGKAATDAKLEALADLCDQEAENENYHQFVGVHERLVKLLLRHLDSEKATDIMRDIAELGGLVELAKS